jgi:hypothetical protein
VAEAWSRIPRDLSAAIGSTGDVVAARALARQLLARSGCTLQNLTLPMVVLAAVCLQLHAATADATLQDLSAFLRRHAEEGRLAERLASSPAQFSRFAAAELLDLTGEQRFNLLEWLADVTELSEDRAA